MEPIETEQTPFEAVTAQSRGLQRVGCAMGFALKDLATNSTEAVSITTRPVHSLRPLPMGRNRARLVLLLHPSLRGARLVYRSVEPQT